MKQSPKLPQPTLSALLGTALGLGLLLGPAALARADDPPKAATAATKDDPSKEKLITESDYLIGVDDVINIAVIGHEELTQVVTVLSDGKIRANGMDDDIKAEGLTLGELKDKIYKGLDRLYNNINLSVSIRESHSRNVTIIGARISGQYPLRKGMRISTLIAAAGGLAGKTKLTSGILIRDYKPKRFDIAKITGADPDPKEDALLQANDQIVLDTKDEPLPPVVNVLGAVYRPGSFATSADAPPATIAQALAQAGGPISEKAALTRGFLLRHGQRIPLNLYPLVMEGKADSPEAKMVLQDGDVLNIPEIQAKFMVWGNVNRPSDFVLPEQKKLTPLDALAEAGGPSQGAEIGKAKLYRTVNGKQTEFSLNLKDVKSQTKPTANLVMQDGDVLFIPQRGRKFSFSDITSPLWALSLLGFRPFY